MDLAPGTRIGRYVVEALLGRGGMASVYRVRHEELGTPYALKLLHLSSAIVRDRLKREGQMQSGLRHPNVVSVFDVVTHEGCPGLVMEYVDGPTLHVLIHAEPDIPLPVRDAIVTGLVHGVRAAHKVGLVHRDLKPANILLARTDEQLVPKVADFGLAKALADEHSPDRHTQTGAFLGTPVYMAPEQVRNARDVTERADIYALGVILYELVTRRLPVDSADLIEMFSRVVRRDYPRPSELVADLPEWQEEAILGALEPDPSKRIPDCDVLLAVWRNKVRFDQDRVPAIERTSPFDLAFLRRTAALGVGDGLPQPPTEPRPPPPGASPTEPTAPPAPPPVTAIRPGTSGGTKTAAFVLGGAGAFGALVGVAGLLVLAVGGSVWALRTGEDPPSPPPAVAPPAVVAPLPDPRPVPAVPAAPVPAAPATPVTSPSPSPKPRPRAATGKVSVTGDARSVTLLRAGERLRPGVVPVGIYQVEATFPTKGTVRTPLSITVTAGGVVVVECVDAFGTCKKGAG